MSIFRKHLQGVFNEKSTKNNAITVNFPWTEWMGFTFMCSSNPFSNTLKRGWNSLSLFSTKTRKYFPFISAFRFVFGLYNFCTCSKFCVFLKRYGFCTVRWLLKRQRAREKNKNRWMKNKFSWLLRKENKGWRNQFIVRNCIFKKFIGFALKIFRDVKKVCRHDSGDSSNDVTLKKFGNTLQRL